MLCLIILKKELPNESVEKNSRNRNFYRDRRVCWTQPWRATFYLLRDTRDTRFRLDCPSQSRTSVNPGERCRGGTAHRASLRNRRVQLLEFAACTKIVSQSLGFEVGYKGYLVYHVDTIEMALAFRPRLYKCPRCFYLDRRLGLEFNLKKLG